jgi:catechol 2,3-dioxygenase-like lactoylglutathione lyase family enzyme
MFSLSSCKVGASIAVSDLARARRFYEDVLGLAAEIDAGDNVEYRCAEDTMVYVFESPNAGTAQATLASWRVEDIDVAVEQLGTQGVVFERYATGPVVTDDRGVASFGDNRIAYFKDPDGNVLSIAEVATAGVSPLGATTVATRLPARDLARAQAWYHDKLGLDPSESRPGGLLFQLGPTAFALFESAGRPSGDHTQMAFDVADINAVVHELQERGVEFDDVDVPGLRTVDKIADIDGNYRSKGTAERGAWFRDCEGNLLGIGQSVP